MKTPALDSETASKVLAADLKNILDRVRRGEPLTGAQRKLIADAAKATPPAVAADAPAYAKNQSELARLLNTSRQHVHWLAKQPGAPSPRPDGRHSVADWKAYLASHARPGSEHEGGDLAAARLRGETLRNWKLEFRNAVMQREYLPKTEVFRVCAVAIQSAKTRSFSGLSRLVTLVRLAKDDESALKAAREEITEVWRFMASAEWFKPDPKNNDQPTP